MDIKTFALALSIIAGSMHVVAFAIYNAQMLSGKSVPNTVTWTLWVFLTVLNASSYFDMSGDLVKSILPAASSTACILTFLFVLSKRKFEKFKSWDEYMALALGILAGLAWWYFRSSTYAQYILQGAIGISFYPTIKGVWRSPLIEKALPWYIWSGAYILMIIVVFLGWKGQLKELVYPVNCLWLHAVVGLLTLRRSPFRKGTIILPGFKVI